VYIYFYVPPLTTAVLSEKNLTCLVKKSSVHHYDTGRVNRRLHHRRRHRRRVNHHRNGHHVNNNEFVFSFALYNTHILYIYIQLCVRVLVFYRSLCISVSVRVYYIRGCHGILFCAGRAVEIYATKVNLIF